MLHDKAKSADPVGDVATYLTDLATRGFLDEVNPWTSDSMPMGEVLIPVKKIISCTSWSPDEDFEPLFWALAEVSAEMSSSQRLVVFITGKGELRDSFERRYKDIKSSRPEFADRIRVCFLWLPFKDYPLLLQAADFGLSMHESSSGLDLPMKVVDMFGFGHLPVLARNFAAMGELVQDGDNGYLWSTKEELKDLLLNRVIKEQCDYAALRANVQNGFAAETWEEVWEASLWARFQADAGRAEVQKTR